MARLFHAGNCDRRALVYDVDTVRRVDYVMSVDTDAGEVVRAHYPLRLVGDEVSTYTERYRTVHPIFGGQPFPQLFHCYGRLD
jgi:hypothetical protein